MYEVRVIYKQDSSIQAMLPSNAVVVGPQTIHLFGPFLNSYSAENCVIAMCSRTDVLSAVIVEKEDRP